MRQIQEVIVGEPPLRELSWSYRRGAERQQCVLSLDATRRMYEMRVRLEGVQRPVRMERFNFVSQALSRQCEYEADLLAAGFSLEDFAAGARMN